jgi:hypothetical protein
MPMPDTLTSLETAIRCSVAADTFAETQSLLGRYAAELERRLRASPGDCDQIRALQKRTGLLFEFAAAILSASRDYKAHELAQLQSISRYRYSADPLRVRDQG